MEEWLNNMSPFLSIVDGILLTQAGIHWYPFLLGYCSVWKVTRHSVQRFEVRAVALAA